MNQGRVPGGWGTRWLKSCLASANICEGVNVGSVLVLRGNVEGWTPELVGLILTYLPTVPT